MAANEMVWNIEVEGVPYKIELKKNKISINGREPMKLNKLLKTGNTWETTYRVPLDGKEALLHVRQFSAPALSFQGKDCSTGEEYVPMKVPGWVWIFIVLHAIDFFILIGGAIGGALQFLVIALMVSASANTKKKTSVRVLSCVAIWLLSTIVQFILALGLLSLTY